MINQQFSKDSAYWNIPADQLLTSLQTTQNGLSTAEAEKRSKEAGPNSLTVTRRATPLILFLNQFKSPLVLILLFAVAVSAFAQEWIDATVIFVIVVASAVITFIQEYSATNAVEKLRAHLAHNINTLRNRQEQSIPVETIVPGDIVLLSAGNLIPADGVVLEGKDFFVNQAVLTGETFPVKKEAGVVPESASLTERTNCVFMGTSVRSGTAKVLIVQTGAATNYGQIADRLSLRPPETEFERGIRHFGLMLSQIMIVLILIVFAMSVVFAKPPIDSLLFAIALAVGISPELLPAIITINLSKGARVMAKRGVIVRQLNAIENFGSMDVLCTDKTGTLTEGVVRLDGALDIKGNPSDEVFRFAYLNAHFQTGLSNPLDEAITSQKQLDLKNVAKLDEVPYDFTRKRLSIIVQEKAGSPLLITKGALDNVLEICRSIREGEKTIPLDATQTKQIQERF
ncbi:MAG TPA: HAD-IC family P-type ATPase, partial [Anaerolineales bacterium]